MPQFHLTHNIFPIIQIIQEHTVFGYENEKKRKQNFFSVNNYAQATNCFGLMYR